MHSLSGDFMRDFFKPESLNFLGDTEEVLTPSLAGTQPAPHGGCNDS
jgi:hypothetical protein